MKIDICLSSNSRSGYSQDAVDLFAKPNGAKHQFRYASKWVSQTVLDRISQRAYEHEPQAMLCYVDQKTKNVPPVVMPVRYASIAEVRKHGSTLSIIFKLRDFCRFDSLRCLNEAFSAAASEIPRYVDGELAGKYWFQGEESKLLSIGRSNSLADWEKLIGAYYETPNSIGDMPFYRFEGIFDSKTDKELGTSHEGGDLVYELGGGKEYEARVYHFHPKNDFPEYALEVTSDDGNLVPLNGNSRALNTRYDRKDYKFATKRIMLGAVTSLAFRRSDQVTRKPIWEDFVVRVRIKRSWGLVLTYVGIIAVGFATPFIVRTYTDPENHWPVTLAAVLGGLGVGIATLAKEKIRL